MVGKNTPVIYRRVKPMGHWFPFMYDTKHPQRGIGNAKLNRSPGRRNEHLHRDSMKIRPLTPDNHAKVSALLRQAFPGSTHEVQLVENFHGNGRDVHEWVAIHINTVIAYIAFSNAYNNTAVCGLHLMLLAVKPEFQNQGIGSEMLRFALRQEIIQANTIFVLGNPAFYRKFGFAPCSMPVCPFAGKGVQFLSISNTATEQFTVGYEPELSMAQKRKNPTAKSTKTVRPAKKTGKTRPRG
jgi:putative acetyltransferase